MIQNPNEFETNVRSNMTEENASPPLSDCNGQENTENSEASNASPDGPLPDLKFGFEELCPVCGDKVSGYHYGLLTCESCKGFFKRTVQNKKVYSCVDNRSCHIDKSQRKRCPYCRFQKCLSVGMRLEAVRQDRMRGGRNKFGPMYKRDRALKQQAIRQQQQILATCQMRLANGLDPLYASREGQDVKPDPALLMSISNSLGYNINGMSIDLNSSTSMPPTSYPNSTIPSPTSPTSPRSPLDNSPRDLRLAGNQGHGTSVPQSPSELSVDSQGPMYHAGHMGGGTVRMSPSISDYNNSYYQAVPHPAVVPFLPQLIVDLKASALDEREIKNKLLNFIDTEVGHDEMTMSNYSPKLLRLLCRLTDQLLFLLVEWARTSVFFRELKVEDQMKLLQNCWSEILILDLAQRLLKMTWSGDLTLANGQKLSLNSLDDLGLSDMKDKILDLVRKIKELKIDDNEYTCLKFLLLF